MSELLARPESWRAASSIALVVAIVGFVLGESFGWWALIASGVLFAVELVLLRRRRD